MLVRILRITAWAVALTTCAIFAGLVLGLGPDLTDDERWAYPFAFVALAPAIVGLLIAIRQPRNVIAWILLVGSVSSAPFYLFIPDMGWSLQFSRAMWPLLYAWPIAVAYVFPNGRLLSRRWRWVAGGAVFSFVAFLSVAMLDNDPFDPPRAAVHNPMAGVHHPGWLDWIWVPFWIGTLASLFAGALAIRLRLRRSSGVERLQTLWVAWAAILIPLGLLTCFAGWGIGVPFADAALFVILMLMPVALAVSVGIAVIRYRLYAIERLVNRTAVYGTLTLLLAATYIAITLAAGVAVGRGSDWVTAGATLVVALSFRPLRARVQSIVDRRFDRARSDGLRAVQEFENDVREGARAPEEIGAVLALALRDPAGGARVLAARERDVCELVGRARRDAAGRRARALGDHARGRADRRAAARPGVARASRLAATTSSRPGRSRRRSRACASRCACNSQEVQASRVRIVEAGYEERRRLERDLHDGAQQRLVSLGLQIRRMQRSLPREAGVLAPALDQIVDEVGSAIGDLRQIAAGVRPARLDDGLAAALHDLARTAPIPVDVEAAIGRVAASVEAAAYFVVCEAITNAVKHSSATRIELSARREKGTLRVSVVDDGVGGARARRGSGLAGLDDRISAHGGTLAIASPQGGGTRIEVAIPCDS